MRWLLFSSVDVDSCTILTSSAFFLSSANKLWRVLLHFELSDGRGRQFRHRVVLGRAGCDAEPAAGFVVEFCDLSPRLSQSQ